MSSSSTCSDEYEIDSRYLIREFRDSLRGLVGMTRAEYRKYHAFYLDELIRTCKTLPRHNFRNDPVRWNSDFLSDCILNEKGISCMAGERFLKLYT